MSSTSSRASNRRVGILPMRNVSRHGAAPQDESANACIFNIRHIVPGNERPAFAETKCGKVSQDLLSLIKFTPSDTDLHQTCFLAHVPHETAHVALPARSRG